MDASIISVKNTNAVTKSAGGVQSLIRALSLLDALAEHEDGLPLTALAKQVGLPPSSAHRLLTTLQRRRFVRFEQNGMVWRVGVQAFIVGAAFARSRELAPLATPHMRRLMETCGETVNLFVANNGLSVCIAQVQSRHTIRAISRPGGGIPLERSAAGKAVLAQMSRSEVEDLLSGEAPDVAGPSVHKFRKLHAELRRVRERGFSFDDEGVAAGLRCIAAPIFDEHGAPVAALSIAGPTSRLTDDRLPRLADKVQTVSDAVTGDFGGVSALGPRASGPQASRGRRFPSAPRPGAIFENSTRPLLRR